MSGAAWPEPVFALAGHGGSPRTASVLPPCDFRATSVPPPSRGCRPVAGAAADGCFAGRECTAKPGHGMGGGVARSAGCGCRAGPTRAAQDMRGRRCPQHRGCVYGASACQAALSWRVVACCLGVIPFLDYFVGFACRATALSALHLRVLDRYRNGIIAPAAAPASAGPASPESWRPAAGCCR